jgi:hypothetical protein
MSLGVLFGAVLGAILGLTFGVIWAGGIGIGGAGFSSRFCPRDLPADASLKARATAGFATSKLICVTAKGPDCRDQTIKPLDPSHQDLNRPT